LDFIEEALASKEADKMAGSNRKILIHCRMGRGRSMSIAAAYLMRFKKMTFNDALDYLTSKND
jgi:protein-tyrosine phosphatase